MDFLLVIIYPGNATVTALIIGGKFIAFEAAAITYQYCFGNVETICLNADYIKNSPVVLENFNLEKGEIRYVTLKQESNNSRIFL